jgi:hypothetical protein
MSGPGRASPGDPAPGTGGALAHRIRGAIRLRLPWLQRLDGCRAPRGDRSWCRQGQPRHGRPVRVHPGGRRSCPRPLGRRLVRRRQPRRQTRVRPTRLGPGGRGGHGPPRHRSRRAVRSRRSQHCWLYSLCAEEDSNLHPLSVDQALNPVTRVSDGSNASRSSRTSAGMDGMDAMDDLHVAAVVAMAGAANGIRSLVTVDVAACDLRRGSLRQRPELRIPSAVVQSLAPVSLADAAEFGT